MVVAGGWSFTTFARSAVFQLPLKYEGQKFNVRGRWVRNSMLGEDGRIPQLLLACHLLFSASAHYTTSASASAHYTTSATSVASDVLWRCSEMRSAQKPLPLCALIRLHSTESGYRAPNQVTEHHGWDCASESGYGAPVSLRQCQARAILHMSGIFHVLPSAAGQSGWLATG